MQVANLCPLQTSKTIATCICLAAMLFKSPFCLGQQKTEREAANQLISLVESGDTGKSDQAHKLFSSLPAEAKCKQEAALALTMLYIRDRHFSDAWKMLTSVPQNPASSSDTVKSVKERLKLWLLLEANVADKARAQLTEITEKTLTADSGDPDLAANCCFIGSVAGMLQSDNATPCIPDSILASVLDQLLAKVESANAKTKLRERLAENRQWGTELVALVSKFEGLEDAEVQQMLSSTQAELDGVRKELMQLRGELKSAGGEKRVLEDQRRKWIQGRKAVLQEMTRETPGKPQYPVEPGPAPLHPIQPRGHYRVDPKTQVAKYVPPSACDESRYRDELKAYDERAQKWRVRSANYQRDLLEYPTKIKIWEQQDAARRASLYDQKQKTELGMASTENAMKGMQDEIQKGVAKDLKDIVEQQKKLERLVEMSNVALRYITEKDTKAKRLIRPSSFPILDYEAECNRLKKSLSERHSVAPAPNLDM